MWSETFLILLAMGRNIIFLRLSIKTLEVLDTEIFPFSDYIFHLPHLHASKIFLSKQCISKHFPTKFPTRKSTSQPTAHSENNYHHKHPLRFPPRPRVRNWSTTTLHALRGCSPGYPGEVTNVWLWPMYEGKGVRVRARERERERERERVAKIGWKIIGERTAAATVVHIRPLM